MSISVERLDHLVLTVRDIERAACFYETILGMTRQTFADGRVSLHFGRQKINLHPHPTDVDIVADIPAPGTADLCFIVGQPLEAVSAYLAVQGVTVLLGPIVRTGAEGPITSVYIRDPDHNLIELSVYG